LEVKVPYDDPDPTDPNVLVGVMLRADAEATREMAYVFAEEFTRMGHDKEQILALFKNPYYGGAHGAYMALGEEAIQAIIDECINVWGRVRIVIRDEGEGMRAEKENSSLIPHPSSFGKGR
jgi:hypothetical protein